MCGIIGFLSTSNKNFTTNEKFLPAVRALIKSVESRGKDACGFVATEKGDAYWQKFSYSATRFLKKKEKILAEKILSADSFTFHARLGTGGHPSQLINNHPHVSEDGRFLLVHNGTLSEDKEFLAPMKSLIQGACDTETILRYIELQAGLPGFDMVETLNKFMENISGNYALVIHDLKKRKIYLYRDNNRPLFLADYDDFVIFGSTLEILADFVRVYETKPLAYYKIDDDNILVYDMIKKTVAKAGKVAKHKVGPIKYTSSIYSGTSSYYGDRWWEGGRDTTLTAMSKKERKKLKKQLIRKYGTDLVL